MWRVFPPRGESGHFMQQITWLALGYNAPVHPSKSRVYVWRKLKELGAEYFRPGVAVLPKDAGNLARFRALAAKIKEMGGEAVIAELKFCDARDESELVGRFERQSELEYKELMRDSRGAISLTSAERDEHLKKLMKRYGKVKSRDYFGSRSRDSVSHGLIDLADDMERVASGLGRQFKHLLDL